MDNIVVIFLICIFITSSFSYNQLVKKGSTIATSSTTYQAFNASRAVDENFDQNIRHCSHTDYSCSIKEAWLQIDLRRVYSIRYVKFWYRSDRTDGKNTLRLPGYSILVSDESWPNSTCYKDPKNKNLPSIIENECRATTQYIWFYQPYTSPDDCAPMLEICEVQVYGCDVGIYGENCSMTCGLCKSGSCDIVTGQCDESGCIHQGFQAPACNGCDVGLYGEDCSMTCGLCKSGTCDTVTGQCDDLGCAYSGFKVSYCNECLPGLYGPNCTSFWNDHCMNITYNQSSSSCLEDSATENKGDKSNEREQVGLCCSDVMPILFSIIAVFCISLILNVVTITWICREKRNQREQAFDTAFDTATNGATVRPNTNDDTATNGATVRPNPNDANEDNKEYQELNEINREYQELGHSIEPSLYEKLDG